VLTWCDVLPVVRCVSRTRPAERRALLAQLAEQAVGPVALCEGQPGEAPRDNWRRFLGLAGNSGRRWTLHCEDDACLSPDFAARALLLLAREVANVLTFCCDRKCVLEAWQTGRALVRLRPSELSGTVCFALHSDLAPHLLAHLPGWEVAHPEHADGVDLQLADFCRRERLLIQASAPSLAQHRPGPSLLGHSPGRWRHARSYRLAYGEVPPC